MVARAMEPDQSKAKTPSAKSKQAKAYERPRGGQARGNGADQMMYRRERLDDKQLRHAHAAGFGDAANIVTHQVDDHQVLGAIFRRCGEFLRLLAIGVGVRQTR